MRIRLLVLYLGTLLFAFTAVYGQTLVRITADSVRPHVVRLADDKMEGRGAGYKGERTAAKYIANEFRKIGLKPAGTKGYFQQFRFQAYHPIRPWEVLTSRNVLGLIEGTDAALKNEVVVIGAHYDGQGRTGQADPTRQLAADAGDRDEIWNSANDNATGVAAVIEIARALKVARPKRSILFIAFGAEEHGMTGSIYYVNHPIVPLANHVAMINLEKLGRSPERSLTVLGVMSSSAWPGIVEAARAVTGSKIAQGPIAFPDSDHYPFGARGIPAVMFYVSTGADAHQPSDTPDKIDFERTADAARCASAMVETLANSVERPNFLRSPMLDPGLIAHLATGAELDAAGIPKGEGALKVTGVIAGLPAARAGLREGDLLVAVSSLTFAREEPLARLMAGFQDLLQGKLGVSLPMKVLRNKQTLSMTMDLSPVRGK